MKAEMRSKHMEDVDGMRLRECKCREHLCCGICTIFKDVNQILSVFFFLHLSFILDSIRFWWRRHSLLRGLSFLKIGLVKTIFTWGSKWI